MSGDAAVVEPMAPVTVAARAEIAMLTLQLRSVVREACDAEANERERTDDDAAAALRVRLGGLVEERRRALAAELDRVRAEAESALAEARAEAERIVARAERDARRSVPAADGPSDPAEVADAPVPSDELTIVWTEPPQTTHAHDVAPVDVAPVDDTFDDRFDDTVAVVGWAPPPTSNGETAPGSPLAVPPPPPPGSNAVTVVLDVDSFARAFAAAFVAATEHRERTASRVPTAPSADVRAPSTSLPPQRARRRSSFWAHAWHADVLLAFVAMVIVLIVLAAWTS